MSNVHVVHKVTEKVEVRAQLAWARLWLLVLLHVMLIVLVRLRFALSQAVMVSIDRRAVSFRLMFMFMFMFMTMFVRVSFRAQHPQRLLHNKERREPAKDRQPRKHQSAKVQHYSTHTPDKNVAFLLHHHKAHLRALALALAHKTMRDEMQKHVREQAACRERRHGIERCRRDVRGYKRQDEIGY